MPGEECVQARMLVSRSRGKYVAIDGTRVSRGRFLTTADVWLRPQIVDFVRRSSCSVAFDPFAGHDHLLKAMEKLGLSRKARISRQTSSHAVSTAMWLPSPCSMRKELPGINRW